MNKFLLAVSVFSLSAVAADQNPNPTGNSSAVLAEVDGVKLTRADIERKNPARLFQARNTFYETERKAVDEFIDEYLLERQAQKENVTVAELLQRHVNSTIAKDPSDEALRVYLEGIDTAEPFESVKPKIAEHIRQRRILRAKTAYMKSLRNQANVSMRMASPRAMVSMNNTPVRGVADAPVTLIEYSDYECPYCQQTQPSLDKLEAEYKGKLAFAYKDAPLPNHPNAQKAAEAAHCAGVQGKYWEYHDVLVKDKQLEVAKLKENARALKLNPQTFDKCLDSGEQADVVKAHLTEAQNLGLQGTPSFFINGRFFSGALPYEKLREIVEEELSATQQQAGKR